MKKSVGIAVAVIASVSLLGAGAFLYMNRHRPEITYSSAETESIPDKGKNEMKKTAFVFDTDAGTDDAAAFLLIKNLGLKPDYIVATGGNASAEGAVRNSLILKRYLGLDTVIVRGFEAELSDEQSTFHGLDGLANISADMISGLGMTDDDLSDYTGLEAFKKELSGYDSIFYVAVGPVSTLAYLVKDENIRSRITSVYLMGGGLNEFNCSHDAEFNFSKNPDGVRTVLSAGLDLTLFTLDLTNHQRLSSEQIDILERTGMYPEYVAMFRYNMKSNSEYDGIDAAVLHDAMPILYCADRSPFTCEDMAVSCDEYGHTERSEKGYRVHIISGVSEDLLWNSVLGCFSGGSNGQNP